MSEEMGNPGMKIYWFSVIILFLCMFAYHNYNKGNLPGQGDGIEHGSYLYYEKEFHMEKTRNYKKRPAKISSSINSSKSFDTVSEAQYYDTIHADDNDKGKLALKASREYQKMKKLKTRNGGLSYIGKKYSKVLQLVNKAQYDRALIKLKGLVKDPNLDLSSRIMFLNMLANCYKKSGRKQEANQKYLEYLKLLKENYAEEASAVRQIDKLISRIR